MPRVGPARAPRVRCPAAAPPPRPRRQQRPPPAAGRPASAGGCPWSGSGPSGVPSGRAGARVGAPVRGRGVGDRGSAAAGSSARGSRCRSGWPPRQCRAGCCGPAHAGSAPVGPAAGSVRPRPERPWRGLLRPGHQERLLVGGPTGSARHHRQPLVAAPRRVVRRSAGDQRDAPGSGGRRDPRRVPAGCLGAGAGARSPGTPAGASPWRPPRAGRAGRRAVTRRARVPAWWSRHGPPEGSSRADPRSASHHATSPPSGRPRGRRGHRRAGAHRPDRHRGAVGEPHRDGVLGSDRSHPACRARVDDAHGWPRDAVRHVRGGAVARRRSGPRPRRPPAPPPAGGRRPGRWRPTGPSRTARHPGCLPTAAAARRARPAGTGEPKVDDPDPRRASPALPVAIRSGASDPSRRSATVCTIRFIECVVGLPTAYTMVAV